MTGRAPRASGKDVLSALRRAGWYVSTIEGSHHILRHDTRPGRVTVPVHGTTILAPKTLHAILSQAGLSEDDLRALL